jgi:hypothetical protein
MGFFGDTTTSAIILRLVWKLRVAAAFRRRKGCEIDREAARVRRVEGMRAAMIGGMDGVVRLEWVEM